MSDNDLMLAAINGFAAGAGLRPPRRNADRVRIRLSDEAEIEAAPSADGFDAQLICRGIASCVFTARTAVRFAYVLRMLKRIAERETAKAIADQATPAAQGTRSLVSARG